MADILDKFIKAAKGSVASGYYSGGGVFEGKKVSLRKKLEARKFSLIAEIKHASPAGEYSLGNIDVEKTAQGFLENGADAISVVVEPQIFRGNIGNVAIAKKTGLPVLFKDFVISGEQIEAAARCGADAMLLVARACDRLHLGVEPMIEKAHSLGLEVLLECYDEKEMEAALATDADILGINNRDLQTLKVDLNRTGDIVKKFGKKIGKPLISESGVRNRADVEFLMGCGVNGVLVGTAIWKAKDIGEKIRELKGDSWMERYFGRYGGQFVPETLVPALSELEAAYAKFGADGEFRRELGSYLKNYAGRETPLYFAERLTEKCGGAKIYLKREDLLHTGAHKINNALGQALLAKRMGKARLIAETGAGQHGVATATVAALFGMECDVYMGSVDVERQSPNVYRMKLLGANVRVVESGSRTLKDAINEAMRDYSASFEHTHYLIGSALGPHPYPTMVRDFQSVIGKEARRQILEAEGRLPDALVACVGGGSNAIGLFYPFMGDKVEMIGVEAGGDGKRHAERLTGKGREGVLHGMKTYLLEDGNGQITETYSVSAGLDYPAVGPQHSHFSDLKRVKYCSASDSEALSAFHLLSECEGIIPALESSHAVAYAAKIAKGMGREKTIIVNLSGRGDKDVEHVKRFEAGSHE